MDNLWLLYWITRLDTIQDTFVALLIISGIASVIHFCFTPVTLFEGGMSKKTYIRIWIGIIFVAFIGGLGKVLTPSKEDALFIGAGVAVTEVVQSESAKRIASKSVGVIEAWLDKQQKDMKKEK